MFQFIIQNAKYFALLTSFFYATDGCADILLFRTGDKASYTISQTLVSEHKFFDETTCSQSESTIDLDIEILSCSNETSDYHFDVEITLRKIIISEFQQDGKSSTIIRYNSGYSKGELENSVLATHLDKLINHPLVFRVEKDFQVKETTGHLTQMNENFDSPSSMGLFGTTPWTFELLFTQLFHLSGENLLPRNSYPASCYQFLNWEDEALDEHEISLHQNSAYIVNAIDSKKIEASWKGHAKVASVADDLAGEVFVIGNVTWDIANPMIQTRDLEVKMEETHNGFFPVYIKMSAKQTWQPASP